MSGPPGGDPPDGDAPGGGGGGGGGGEGGAEGDATTSGAANLNDFSLYFVIGLWVLYLAPIILKFLKNKPKKWLFYKKDKDIQITKHVGMPSKFE